MKEKAGIQAVILDWAGTAVDYGCLAPLAVFMEVFRCRSIEVTPEEVRAPMGKMKRDHIREMCSMERIRSLWKQLYGRMPGEADADELFAQFEPMLLSILNRYADPLPHVKEVISHLRETGVKIGSTTGYTRSMMNIVAPEAARRGYAPDFVIASDEVPSGRPHPYMCWQNAINLKVYPLSAILKVGDTLADIEEGLNASVWSVGVVTGSSLMGLSREEAAAMDPTELDLRRKNTVELYRRAGAHAILDSMADLPGLVDAMNENLKCIRGLESHRDIIPPKYR